MDTLQHEIMGLPDDQWDEFFTWVVNTEYKRRQAMPQIEQAQAEIMAEVWEQQPELKPEFTTGTTDLFDTVEEAVAAAKPWVKPTNRSTAYPYKAETGHKGRVWENERRGLNGAEPGKPFSGWRDKTDELVKPAAPEVPEAPQPEPAKPEPEVTPADTVPLYRDGERLARGETRRYTDGKVYVWQKTKLEPTKPETAPDKDTGHWLHLG